MNASFGGANSDSMGVLAKALVVAPLVGRIALLVGQCKSQALLANGLYNGADSCGGKYIEQRT